MSEPVSNVEIEDVLSSIRRLVSEENRPPLRRTPKDEPRKPTRLVLTPSLLVADSVADGSEDEAVSEPVTDSPEIAREAAQVADPVPDEPETTHEVSEEDAEEMVAAAVDTEIDEAAPNATTEISQDEAQEHIEEAAQTAEADGPADLSGFKQTGGDDPDTNLHADDTPWIDPDATLFEAAESAETPSDDNMDLSDENLAETAQEAVAEDHEQTDDLPDEAPTDEASAQPDWWRTQTPDEDAQPLEAQDDVGEMAPSEPTGSEESLAQADETDPLPTDHDRLNTATLSDKIAALEAKIGQTQDQWEPDGETDDDYAGTPVETIEWQDHDASAEPEVEAETDADVTPPDAEADELQDAAEAANATAAAAQADPNHDDDLLDILSDDDTILDEESLRELVAEIVRQELQGALGERITRNVRKLVRREIHRALTAQELD